MLKMFEKMVEKERELIKDDIKNNPSSYGCLATSDRFIKEESIRKALDKYGGLLDLSMIGEEPIIGEGQFPFEDRVFSIEQFLNGITRSENFVNIFIKHSETNVKMSSVYRCIREEIFDILDKEYNTVRVRENMPLPKDAVFIKRDSSNMYADYVYYWSQSEKKIYEERISLGD